MVQLFQSLTDERSVYLCRMNCFGGAYLCAGAAVGTNFRINHIDVTLRDSINRAFVDTCSASNTIFSNYVSHNKK